MAQRVTPVDISDCEALSTADRAYSSTLGVEPIIDRASVHFYQRSGHSFAARGCPDDTGDSAHGAGTSGGLERLAGFVLAHASWSGGRPVVRVERLVTVPGCEAASGALVAAVVKSAYDAGVYDIVAAVPSTDAVAASALAGAAFGEDDVSVYVRVLGSRGSPSLGG